MYDKGIMDFGREINQLYLHQTLKNFAISIIGVFIPVYIVSEGFSIYHAAYFILLSGLIGFVFSFPLAKVVSRLGFKKSISISFLFTLPGLALIRAFDLSLVLITVSGVLYNLGRSLHSISLSSGFALLSEDKSRDKDSGKMLSLPSISRVVAPFLGGTIFALFGFQQLLLVSIAVLLLSILPLLLTGDHHDNVSFKGLSHVLENYGEEVKFFSIRGIQSVAGVSITALFVYTLIGGSVDVGTARALDSLGFTVTGLLAGYLADKYGRNNILKIGTVGAGISHVFRGLMQTPLQMFTLSFIAGIFFQTYHVPLYSKFAEIADRKEKILEFYTVRKTFIGLGQTITVLLLLGSNYFLELRQAFITTFLLASIATFYMGIRFEKL